MIIKGKNVLVTGGSKGIGRAIVEAMAEQGANVVVNYNSDESAANEVAEATKNYQGKMVVVKADITKQDEVDTMFNKIKTELGSLDILVNNAGIYDENDGPDNVEVIENIFRTNLFAQVRVTNAARRLMTKGKIVFISSIHGRLGHGRPDAIGYSASKAALDSYTKNLARALAPDILVNAVAPGRTLTPQWGVMTDDEEAALAADQLISRWIEPSEIADSVVFLAKNDAVCGEVLVIDGGMSLKVFG